MTNIGWVGGDGYNWARYEPDAPADPNHANTDRTAETIFTPMKNYAAKVDKPWVIGEFGQHTDRGRPAFRANRNDTNIRWAAANGCAAFCLYHSPFTDAANPASPPGDDGPWWLDVMHNYANHNDRTTPDPDSVTSLRDLLADYGRA